MTYRSVPFQTLFLVLFFALPLWGQAMVTGSWEGHGFSLESKEKLQRHLVSSVAEGQIPGGIVLIIHQGEVVFREAFGMRHIRRQVPFELTTPFHAASLSKSIISTLVVDLAADGILDLDSPIDRYLPDATHLKIDLTHPADRIPTVRECLHHTAGFIADEEPGGRPWLTFRGQAMTLKQAVDVELQLPLKRQPGTKFAYSGIGYDIVGRIVEVVTDESLEDVLQKRLCDPLGMNETTYYANRKTSRNMASFYWRRRSDGSLRRQLDERIVEPGLYSSVGGGIVTTTDDLARFMMMHRNGGWVGDKEWTSSDMLRQQYRRKRPGAYYGIGFTLGPAKESNEASWILHTGSSGTMFWLDRESDTIGIIITQQRYSDGAEMPESKKLIAHDTDSWQKTLKTEYIDPVFGWRPLR